MRSSLLRFNSRKERVRTKIQKVSDRNRLSVYKSNKHIYAQIIDDVNSVTVASASTLDKEIIQKGKSNLNKDFAAKVGELIAKRAVEKGISEVVFDKSGFKYHGVIKELADSARKNNLIF